MKTTSRMYVKRVEQRGHEDVLVHVDWEGTSEEDIKLMAHYYVLHRAKNWLEQEEKVLPESMSFRAADYVHNEPLVNKELHIPVEGKTSKPKHSKSYNQLHDFLSGLSKEELATLLR